MRKKILIFAHDVTLAHFVRPLAFIEALDPQEYEIHLASSMKYKSLCSNKNIQHVHCASIDQAKFASLVNGAKPIYDAKTYAEHVDQDFKIIDKIRPDIVIGDFRHSLSVSCRIKKIKYINITNAYWSPHILLKNPMPEAPIVRLLGEKIFNILLKVFTPIILKINFFIMVFIIRHSLKRVGLRYSDYRQVITDGDVVAYCDAEELVQLKSKNHREQFIGPLVWSNPQPLPDWWSKLSANKKKIFVSMGSSGDVSLVPLIVNVLRQMDVEILVAATQLDANIKSLPNVYVAEHLPLEKIMSNVSLVICNGGSPLSNLALKFAVPLIGIVFNNDQLLNMAHVESKGAGLIVRPWQMTQATLSQEITKVLNNPNFHDSARAISQIYRKINIAEKCRDLITSALKS